MLTNQDFEDNTYDPVTFYTNDNYSDMHMTHLSTFQTTKLYTYHHGWCQHHHLENQQANLNDLFYICHAQLDFKLWSVHASSRWRCPYWTVSLWGNALPSKSYNRGRDYYSSFKFLSYLLLGSNNWDGLLEWYQLQQERYIKMRWVHHQSLHFFF